MDHAAYMEDDEACHIKDLMDRLGMVDVVLSKEQIRVLRRRFDTKRVRAWADGEDDIVFKLPERDDLYSILDLDPDANYRRVTFDVEAMRKPLRQVELEERNHRFARSASIAAWIGVLVALLALVMR